MRLMPTVSTYNDLPVTGNFIGDVRKVFSTSTFYIWMSFSSSDTRSNWNALGTAVAEELTSLFELDVNLDLTPVSSASEDVGLFDLDENSDVMPADVEETDEYFEVDVNSDIMPKV